MINLKSKHFSRRLTRLKTLDKIIDELKKLDFKTIEDTEIHDLKIPQMIDAKTLSRHERITAQDKGIGCLVKEFINESGVFILAIITRGAVKQPNGKYQFPPIEIWVKKV